jgi:O-methyltransferase
VSGGTLRRRGLALVEATFRQPQVHRRGQALILGLAERLNYHVLRGMADPGVRPDAARWVQASPWKITQDYVRDGTLELICREIDEAAIPGALAELGVFRGDFAWLMSTHLPDRPVHLFDTFEGFAEAEVKQDEHLVEAFLDFSATDPASVHARFSRPEQVTLHVGRFPETTEGVEEERFALVSIDADLYAPILSGLRWFYPRLSPGGAILVHDFNNAAFGGAKRAVREFQAESGATVIPLPDWGGTGVVTKPRDPDAGPSAVPQRPT